MDLMQSVDVKQLVTRINSIVQPMLSNHIQEIRECYQQAAHCAEEAEAQNDAKVKKQLLELTRLWLLLAQGYESATH